MKYLTGREFSGVISSEEATSADEDPKNRGRYRVLIPELMYNCYDDDGQIYCVNHVTKYRNAYCNTGEGIYGQYFPLHPGTRVIVKFYKEDIQTAYIDRIVGDFHQDSLPLELSGGNRDNYYQLLRTIANDLIAVTDQTSMSSVPKHSMVFYHKKDNVQVTFDETGIHIYTKQALDTQITKEAFIKVDDTIDIVIGKECQISIGSDNKIHIKGNNDLTVSGDCRVSIEGSGHVSVKGNCNIGVSGTCNVNANIINLNCGSSLTPEISSIQAGIEAVESLSKNIESNKALADSVNAAKETASNAVESVKNVTKENLQETMDHLNNLSTDLSNAKKDAINNLSQMNTSQDYLTKVSENSKKAVSDVSDKLNEAKEKFGDDSEIVQKLEEKKRVLEQIDQNIDKQVSDLQNCLQQSLNEVTNIDTNSDKIDDLTDHGITTWM